MSVNSPFQSASTSGQGTYGQAQQTQSYGPFAVGYQASPQDIWGSLGSVLSSPQTYKTLIDLVGMLNASPTGQQQPGMPGQYGQQQASPQDIWGSLGSVLSSPQTRKTLIDLVGMLNASPTGQQQPGMPGQYGQQQASPQDIWGSLGSVLSSPQTRKTLIDLVGMLNASPTGQQQPGMPGQYGQQQASPQDIWGSLGSAFGSAGQAISSAAPDILHVAQQVAPYLPIALALASASPTGQQQPGMPGQYGQQQASPQDIWGSLGSVLSSPQTRKTLIDLVGMLNASPTGQQQPGMPGQYGQQH